MFGFLKKIFPDMPNIEECVPHLVKPSEKCDIKNIPSKYEIESTRHQLEDLNNAITKGQENVVASTKSYILCKETQESKNV